MSPNEVLPAAFGADRDRRVRPEPATVQSDPGERPCSV